MKDDSSPTGGITPSERYLSGLANRSFLSLWSYSNLHTAEGRKNNKGDGKEFCDLMVVFDDRILLFSDKHSEFPDCSDMSVAWGRWYRRAIEKSVRQLKGAEQWLVQARGPLFLDRQCQIPLDLSLPDIATSKIHLIAVTRGAHDACAKYFGGGSSGSFILDSSITYEDRVSKPFRLGWQLPERRFVHVFDESILDIALSELDTIVDFVNYLDEKEAFFKAEDRLVMVPAEEDLIAEYLTTMNENGRHSLPEFPSEYDGIMISEGLWREFHQSDTYKRRTEANQISYLWDSLIEYQAKFIQIGTALAQDAMTGEPAQISFDDHEWVVRALADESRFHRRILAEQLHGALQVNEPGRHFSRSGIFGHRPTRGYVFLVTPRPKDCDYENYRDIRRGKLLAYCHGMKLRDENLAECIGIASEPMQSEAASQDFIRIEFGSGPLSDEERHDIQEMCEELEIYNPNTMVERRGKTFEFPHEEVRPSMNRAQRRAEAAIKRRRKRRQ